MGCESKTRELARRLSGGDEILLLWNPRDGHVEVSVRDVDTGVGFQLEVAPASALDAFHHPYAYVAVLGRNRG
jgi:hypothetical protein